MCGGDPNSLTVSNKWRGYSPRVWRWSLFNKVVDVIVIVFSTCVEVILSSPAWIASTWCILHVCGGDPQIYVLTGHDPKYSPRVWRWSYLKSKARFNRCVFSTCVEVILFIYWINLHILCILHVCGGDPIVRPPTNISKLYSPRVWRWSLLERPNSKLDRVFSTCVEVIPFVRNTEHLCWGILHVCGGDPKRKYTQLVRQ